MYSLMVYKQDESIKSKHVAPGQTLSIGRSELNDIHLPDASSYISRFHAALFCDDEGNCTLQDLGSRNHTDVNATRKGYEQLNEGDRIDIGDYTLVFQRQTEEGESQAFEPVLIDESDDGDTVPTYTPVPLQQGEIEGLEDMNQLRLLCRLRGLANSNLEIEDALQSIVHVLASAFDVDQLFIASLEPEGKRLNCLANLTGQETQIKISQTMLELFLREKQLLVTDDALADERFKKRGQTTPSLREMQVKSVACVPLRWDGEISGMLYMASSQDTGRFEAKDFSLLSLIGDDMSSLIGNRMSRRTLTEEKHRLEKRLAADNAMIGISPKTKEILEHIEQVADTDATVLILGERGTGKELVAHAIHQNSKRNGKPFVAVNCAAIPESLLESELFGHERGAFTSATSLKKGKFELADAGTIFLDEIGDMRLDHQSTLLRVLQEKKIQRVGGTRDISVDVRVIAATNQNLEQKMKQGAFRAEVYDRLNVYRIQVPPLRERKEDIPLLAGYFLHRLRSRDSKPIHRLSNACVELLSVYNWPGNIRELQNAIERSIILAKRSEITPDLFEMIKQKVVEPKSLKEAEKEHIIQVLEYTHRNKTHAWKILGIAEQTLYNKLREYHIEKPEIEHTRPKRGH